ncbi:uncharacterized protein [Saccopteryx bilineata]|uniref:uncharacterized protein n=1 Tax=Saccopteryx bilineata TaxID=59482 RepID=UPI0033904F2C
MIFPGHKKDLFGNQMGYRACCNASCPGLRAHRTHYTPALAHTRTCTLLHAPLLADYRGSGPSVVRRKESSAQHQEVSYILEDDDKRSASFGSWLGLPESTRSLTGEQRPWGLRSSHPQTHAPSLASESRGRLRRGPAMRLSLGLEAGEDPRISSRRAWAPSPCPARGPRPPSLWPPQRGRARSLSSPQTQGASTAPTCGLKAHREQTFGNNLAPSWDALQLPKPRPETYNIGPNSMVLFRHIPI